VSPAFQRAVEFVLPHETEYARGHWGDDQFVVTEDVPGDAGGRTRYGIDARSHPGVDIAHLTRNQAILIYLAEWKRHGLDALPERLAVAMFDVWVNGGQPVQWLQHAINLYPPAGVTWLSPDGVMGPKTLAAAASCDQDKILSAFLQERDGRFELLAQKPSLAQFLNGWLQRDRDLRAYLAIG